MTVTAWSPDGRTQTGASFVDGHAVASVKMITGLASFPRAAASVPILAAIAWQPLGRWGIKAKPSTKS